MNELRSVRQSGIASGSAFGPAPGFLIGHVLIALLAGCTACGYHANPEDERRTDETFRLPAIAVIPFETKSYRRGLEITLSRRVADEIRARSPQSPSSADAADWHVTGTITRADERVLSGDTDDSVRESSFWITCEIVVRDPNTDKIIGTTEFTKYQPFSERAGRFRTDRQASNEVLREIAEATVYWLRGLQVGFSEKDLSPTALPANRPPSEQPPSEQAPIKQEPSKRK
jgi:hypothetical protein